MEALKSLDFARDLQTGGRRLWLAGEPTCRPAKSALSPVRFLVPFMMMCCGPSHTRQQWQCRRWQYVWHGQLSQDVCSVTLDLALRSFACAIYVVFPTSSNDCISSLVGNCTRSYDDLAAYRSPVVSTLYTNQRLAKIT